VEGLLFDGLTSRPWPATVGVEGGRLVVRSLEVGPDGAPLAGLDWPLAAVREAPHSEQRLKLSRDGDDARLVVDAAAWRSLAGDRRAMDRRREWGLVAGLSAAGLGLAAFVFIGVPMAAAPLARWTSPALEARFGANMEAQLTTPFRPCNGDPRGARVLAKLGRDLARSSDSPFEIRVRAVRAPFVNAFALPGGAVLVTDDLIAQARSPDELAAVLAHEIAHVERRHAMQAAWRAMGAGMVLDAVVGGGTGAGQQAVLLFGGFADQRFSRELENEADERAIQLLAARNISTQGMADFFGRMANREDDPRLREAAEWFATHPDSGGRASRAQAAARPGQPALSEADWQSLKRACRRPS
jgi:Zn-dependent protease with chaperone function